MFTVFLLSLHVVVPFHLNSCSTVLNFSFPPFRFFFHRLLFPTVQIIVYHRLGNCSSSFRLLFLFVHTTVPHCQGCCSPPSVVLIRLGCCSPPSRLSPYSPPSTLLFPSV
jgi:hypothetical protein